jgi:hypothetical protein
MNNINEVLPEKYRKHFDVSRESPSYLEAWVSSGTSPTARFPLGEFVCRKDWSEWTNLEKKIRREKFYR